jgi:hypothetical protein
MTHFGDDDVHESMKERLREAELLAVPHRAPHDFAQDVAAPFVRGHHAVGDEKRHRTQVIGDTRIDTSDGRRRRCACTASRALCDGRRGSA